MEYPQQNHQGFYDPKQMAGNQIMPAPTTWDEGKKIPFPDAMTVVERLNKIGKMHNGYFPTGSKANELGKLPLTYPLPLRFFERQQFFNCKQCDYSGFTRTVVEPELSEAGKKVRCCFLMIPFPLCTITALCMYCDTKNRAAISDRHHICPQCETKVATWRFGMPPDEVTLQEVTEVLEKMQSCPDSMRSFLRYF